LGLIVNYRDALIAYINGREVARAGWTEQRATRKK
jgi:hypothetical protein